MLHGYRAAAKATDLGRLALNLTQRANTNRAQKWLHAVQGRQAGRLALDLTICLIWPPCLICLIWPFYPSTFHNGEPAKSTLLPSKRVLNGSDVADWALVAPRAENGTVAKISN